MEIPVPTAAAITNVKISAADKRHHCIFDVSSSFFDSCIILPSPLSSTSSTFESSGDLNPETLALSGNDGKGSKNSVVEPRWTCNTCKAEFESLLDQRSHFKSDIHRFNVKLSIAGKNTVKEEDFDELTSDSFKDYDVSSISGSEDETDKRSCSRSDGHKGSSESVKRKLFMRLQSGEMVSIWKCLLMSESENIVFEDEKTYANGNGGFDQCLRENEVIERLKSLINEPRDHTRLRIVLLASGGHFAGCVFDGKMVVAHKTFHRYVVRAKAGKKQSSKDASGKAISSAGASLRRYNELALKKEIQELLAAWKPYFDASSCIFIYAPSQNRQLLFSGEKPNFNSQHSIVRNVPFTVRRPTFKEAQRIYEHVIQVSYEVEEKEMPTMSKNDTLSSAVTSEDMRKEELIENSKIEAYSHPRESEEPCLSNESENEAICVTTTLHEAAQSGDTNKVLELLEQGLDPCVKDERGRTPYTLASEKEVRNTFRRYMASNLDKWDWNAAKVPSALTKELEESQAAKQAEKDAKKKARAKELKKLRKAKEKKAQAEAALSQNAATVYENQGVVSSSSVKGQVQPKGGSQISKEEALKRARDTEREKRAAAAERRMAAAAAVALDGAGSSSTTKAPSSTSGWVSDLICSCCNASLAGKVPFHRYNFKYCSTSCMHVHREILEDG